jgi:ketosteroid isomerase-like protein
VNTVETRVEILRRFYEGWNADDPGGATLPLLHEAFEYVNPESAVEAGTRHGHAGWLQVGKSARRAFSEFAIDPYELIEAGDRVLVLAIFRARGRDSGVELQVPEQHVWSFQDGKIKRLEWFHDEAQARRVAGL